MTVDDSATDSERAALAQRFDLLSLDRFSFTARLARAEKPKMIRLDAAITADVVQACVISLEPVADELCDRFTLDFVLAEDAGRVDHAVEFAPDEPDPPEVLDSSLLDLGEIAAEHLALVLNPYPRHPDAERLRDARISDGTAVPPRDPDEGPFAVLRKLRDD